VGRPAGASRPGRNHSPSARRDSATEDPPGTSGEGAGYEDTRIGRSRWLRHRRVASTGDRLGQGCAWALTRLGNLVRRRGHATRAAVRFAEGLALARRAAHPPLAARALAGLADLARRRGDLARAHDLYGEGAAALRSPATSAPDTPGGAGARRPIGIASVGRGPGVGPRGAGRPRGRRLAGRRGARVQPTSSASRRRAATRVGSRPAPSLGSIEPTRLCRAGAASARTR
jgi:hypothetical protein